jgi:predicted nucleotidyltransferase
MDKTPQAISPSNALFSQVQQRVLEVIFDDPDRSFYGSEIVRKIDSGVGAVDRELSKLERSGLVLVERIKNRKYYRANSDAPLYAELSALIQKTVVLPQLIRRSLLPYADAITAAFIFGSVAKQTDKPQSDIDLIVVGDKLNFSDLYSAAFAVEKKLNRKVSTLFLSRADWRRKASETGSVINKISRSPKVFIIGSQKDLHGQTRT